MWFFSQALLYIDDVMESVDRSMWELDSFSEFFSQDKEVEMPPRAQFPTIRAMFNAMESSVAKLDEIAAKLARDRKVRTGLLAEETENDPGAQFLDRMQPHMEEMVKYGKEIGGEVYDQVLAFEDIYKAQSEIITWAAGVPMPPRDELIEQCKLQQEALRDAVSYNIDCQGSSPLKAHFQAIADLGHTMDWIIAPNAQKHIKEYKVVVELECDNILSNFIRLDTNPVHTYYSKAVRSFCLELVEYVNREHPAGLRWNYTKGAAPEGYRIKRKVKARLDAHPFLDFLEIIDGPLLEYVYLSEYMSESVFNQAKLMFNAFVKQYELIVRVANQKKTGTERAMRMFVMPTMYEIAEVINTGRTADRDDYFYLHLRAGAEVAEVLKWVIATEIPAAMYTVEMSTASEMILKRLIQKFEGKTNGWLHKRWAESLMKLLSELEVYVNVHHYKELAFDSKYMEEHVRGLWRKRERSVKLKELKESNKDKVRHWTPDMRYLWGTGVVYKGGAPPPPTQPSQTNSVVRHPKPPSTGLRRTAQLQLST